MHGIVRRSSSFNTGRIDHIYRDPHEPRTRLFLHYGDLTDAVGSDTLISSLQPDEVYNLGAQSHVRVSLRHARVHGRRDRRSGTAAAARGDPRARRADARFYQASSSEMYGRCPAAAERDDAVSIRARPTRPPRCSPTGWRSTTARRTASSACNGILLQPRIAAAGGDVRHAQDHARAGPHPGGLQKKLYLGNLDAKRDWGYATDYVDAMWLHAPAGRAGRLRDRHGRDAFRPRVPRAAAAPPRPRLGRTTWRSTRATCGPPRSTCCGATPARRARTFGWTPALDLHRPRPPDGRRRVLKLLEDELTGRTVRL